MPESEPAATPDYPVTPAYGAGRTPGPRSGPAPRSAPGPRSAPPTSRAARTPGSWTAIVLSVVVNAVTLIGVLTFGWPPGNVLLLFWLENAVLGVCTLIKISTARAPSMSQIKINDRDAGSSPALYALFFCLHYGIFCVVHLVFTLVVAIKIGVEPTFLLLGFPLILIVLRYTVETWTTWFGRGDLRQSTSPQQAMTQPYPRIIVLHVSILVAFALVLGNLTGDSRLTELSGYAEPVLALLPPAWRSEGVAVVALLVAIKTVVDVLTTRRALRTR